MQGDLTQADVRAERWAALDMIHRHSPGSTRRLTLGADKGTKRRSKRVTHLRNLRAPCSICLPSVTDVTKNPKLADTRHELAKARDSGE